MYSAFFDILGFLAAAPRTRKELYEHFGVSDYRKTRDALAELVARGLLSRAPSSPDTRDVFSITVKGCEQLEEERARRATASIATIHDDLSQMNEDMRQERAEQKAEKSKDRHFQLFNTLLGAVVGSLVTLLVEHFREITAFVLLHLP